MLLLLRYQAPLSLLERTLEVCVSLSKNLDLPYGLQVLWKNELAPFGKPDKYI